MLTTARSHCAEHAHVWHFVHVYQVFLGVREDSQALHTCFLHLTPFVWRLTISSILGSGSSGESSVVNGPSPGYVHVWSNQVSQWACMGEEPSNSADGKEAEFHELAKAGMSAHARCESVSSSVSLGFCTALVVKS